jgi:hypothetical protein
MPFNLDAFEYYAHQRQYELAAQELINLLRALDENYGGSGPGFSAQLTSTELTVEEVDEQLTTRVAATAAFLLSDPQFQLSPTGLAQLLNWQRWLSTLFAVSPFRNADPVLRALNGAGPGETGKFEIAAKDLNKFCLLYGPESRIPLDLDALWGSSNVLAAGLAMVLLAPRFLGTVVAHEKRELILPWLTRKLPEIPDLDLLPTAILHDVYMHCSYADRADKHDVKRSINELIRRKLTDRGLFSLERPELKPDSKPVLLVVLEWFNALHSIYRTHSRTLEAARERFHVIGMGGKNVDAAGREVFEEFIELPDSNIFDQMNLIRRVSYEKGAHALYMPSVGMHALTMFLCNLRLAPVQLMGLGHPATTHSPEMDYVVVEEDYVGDPACFSEKLLKLPSDGMPYRPSAAAPQLALPSPPREYPETVKIAVAATTMKINPGFLKACARIVEQAARPVHFHFLVGQAIGWVYPQVARLARQYLGDRVTVYPHQSYPDYMAKIASCHLFLDPFPFGNTNGIIDTVTAGLIGVCKTGREVHEHIDEALFTRLGLPSWTIASTVDDYVRAAVRLIGNDKERLQLSRDLSGPQAVAKLFIGRPEIFGQMVFEKVKEAYAQGSPATTVKTKSFSADA